MRVSRRREGDIHRKPSFGRGKRGDELKELGDTIDGLLGRLERAFDAQGRFVQNASHELRTPIAMMRTSLDVATGKPAGASREVTVLAAKLREGLDQAERLLESFLVLARVQNESSIDRSAVFISEVVTEALRTRQDAIDRLGLHVQSDLDEAVALGNETLLAQVAENLVDNAVYHNEPGGCLRVATETSGPVVRLIVENGGAILDHAQLDRLGQPFQRLAADRTESDRGVGLGLSIVDAIARSHGGTMVLSARDGGGLRVTVELPAARAPSAVGPQ